jgi:hydrophobic/amphiphilic exporter-1 (mainly G- bacteria), HAE1 family
MFLSDISIKRPIMISMFLIVFVLFGGLMYTKMNLEFTPEISFPIITVQTVYPGAGPKEIETQVTKKIEDAVSSVSQIDYIQSYSMENVSYVLVAFQMNKDVNLARQEVKDKVDGILNDIPDDAQLPLVQRYDPTVMPIVDLVLYGSLSPTQLYDLADKQLKNRFSQIDGVATVDLTGGQKREINVSIESKTLFQRSVSLQQIAGVLAAQNLEMPAGQFQRNSQEFSVRMNGEFKDIESIRNLEIQTSNGIMKLGDIANINDTGAEVRKRTTYYNQISRQKNDNVVQMSVMKSSGGNQVRVYDSILKLLPEIRKSLPKGCSIEVVNEGTTYIRSSVDDTIFNIFLGVILTGLILLFFLHDLRSTLIVALCMPASIVSTFLFMKLSGFSLNIMSLMGLSTSVGILATDSIVVLENIFRHKKEGLGRIESASKGTSEIALAVLTATMTHLIVFLPLATMPSIAGRLFKQFSLTMVYAVSFSLLISFTLIPMLAAKILPDQDRKKHPIGRWLEWFFQLWDRGYGASLAWFFRSKLRSFAFILCTIALFFGSLQLGKHIGFDFIPPTDEGRVAIKVEMPAGFSLDETGKTVETIESRLKNYQEISHIWTTVGTQGQTAIGVNLAAMNMKLVDRKDRTKSSREMAAIITRDLSDIPNVRIRVSSVLSVTSGRADVECYLLGVDQDSLAVYADRLAIRSKTIPGLINLNTSIRSGKPEITIIPDRVKINDAGPAASNLAVALRGSVDGLVTTHYKDRGEEYDIRVQMIRETVDSPEKIGDIPIIGKTETYRLSQLASVTFTEEYNKIVHQDRAKAVLIEADVAEGYAMGDITKGIIRITDEMHLPPGYKLTMGAMANELKKTTAAMIMAFLIAVTLTYMLLAAVLESLGQPLLILGTVPLSIIGVLGSLYITGLSLNIISMLSIVMLVGIVVSNAILMLDYTNILVRQRGKSVTEALLEACPAKLKPILMANIAIVISLIPMAMGVGASGAELRQPMGVVTIGGIVASTLLSLYFIPILYQMIAGKKRIHAEIASRPGVQS